MLRFPQCVRALVVAMSISASIGDLAAGERPVTFEHDIQPLLTRFGCNSGACHGKSRGQNGFALSNTAGAWTSYKNDGSEVASGELGPTGGIALADTDGDGVDEVVTCTSTDCEIVAVDFDSDGPMKWSEATSRPP